MNLLYLQRAVITLAVIFPFASFAIPKSMGAAFYLMLLCSLMAVVLRLKAAERNFWEILLEYWPVHLAMSGLMLATLLNQITTGRLVSRELELPFQLACFPLFFWILRANQNLKFISWGFVGAALAGLIALYAKSHWGTIRPDVVYNIPVIPFGNLVLLLGALALFSLGWRSDNGNLGRFIKISAGAAGFYAAYLSQARGGWVALPVFMVIALTVFRDIRIRQKLVFLLLAFIFLSGSYIVSDKIRSRVSAAHSDIRHFIDGTDKDTSIGQRLQLWHAGWILFRENPVVGVGRKNYSEAVQQLVARNVLTPVAATQPHSHNDVLFQAVSLGIFGVLAIVSHYLVPAYYFGREIRHPDRKLAITAGMGLAVVGGFFVFGLSDTMFYWRASNMLYAVLLAMLMGSLVQRKNILNKSFCHPQS